MEKRLALFTNKFPYVGGENFLAAELKYLAKEFDQITIFPWEKGEQLELQLPENVKIAYFPKTNQFRLRDLVLKNLGILAKWHWQEFIRSPYRFKYISQFKWNFYRLVGLLDTALVFKRDWLPDMGNTLIYSYWLNEWLTVLALNKDMGMQNLIVSRAHAYDFDKKQQPRGYFPFRYTEWTRVYKIEQVSRYGLAMMDGDFGANGKVELAYLGVEDNGMGPIPDGPKYRIVSCSSFYPAKRMWLIPQILQHLKVDFEWIHFGGGLYQEDVIKDTPKYLAENKYHYVGTTPNQQVLEYYKANPVDLFISVSDKEGLPVSMMEALGFGIPIMGCNACGIPEVVNENTGFLIDENFDPVEVARQMEEFLIKKSRDVEYRKGVRNQYLQKFKASENYAKFASKLAQFQTN